MTLRLVTMTLAHLTLRRVMTCIKRKKKNPLALLYEEPPIFVYADFESMIAEDNTHIPVLVCALTSEDYNFETYYGENCTADLLNFLTQLNSEDMYPVDIALAVVL